MSRSIATACVCTAALLLTAPSVMPRSAGTASAQDAATGGDVLSGKVVETMNSGGYSYICIENKGKKTWVAVPQTTVVKGQTLAFRSGMVMENFESKTLKRTFDRIIFTDAPIDPKIAGQSTSGGSKSTAPKPTEKIKVEKAAGENAVTVAEVYKNRVKLDKKEATVRGKVMKVSTGIMQKNWVHLQDGSGDVKKGTHNLVVTMQELPAMGDVITVKGTIHKDRDFGGNYQYAVIMEDAKLQK